ncbi:MAG: hypothetical protein LJU34_07515 [Oscillospiraceae bacterium]|nr:hypothetical protein [Oscillospiraceae bacterium]
MAATGKHIQKPSKKGLGKGTPIVLLLAGITVAAVGVTVWALFFRDNDAQTDVLTPDYAVQETEENAESMGDESDEKLEASEGGGAVSLTYSTEVTVTLSEKTVSLYFGNPGKSTQDVVLQMVIQDTVVMQSGLITPGNQVSALSLADGAAELLEPGGYDGKFVVLYYDPDTGERAVVTTEIPVTVTVTQ